MAFKIKRYKTSFDKFKRLSVNLSSNYEDAIKLIASQIVNRDLTAHKKRTVDYLKNKNINIETLSAALHSNHSQEMHQEIMNNSNELLYANLYYGDGNLRIESKGHIMAILLSCKKIPKNIVPIQGWEILQNRKKILFYTKGNNLISGDVTLFNYGTGMKVLNAEIIDSAGVKSYAKINIEGVDYWRYLKGNWETMDSVHWNNYKGVF